MLRSADGLAMIVGEPLLVIGELGEALLQHFEFALLVGSNRCLDQVAIPERLLAEFARREHAQAFLWGLAIGDRETTSDMGMAKANSEGGSMI